MLIAIMFLRISSPCFFFIVLILFSSQVLSKKETSLNTKNIEKHLLKLVEFGGRLTGTKSEKRASDYIVNFLKDNDLEPWQSNNYRQPFTFTSGTRLGKRNKLIINDKALRLEEDYRPLVFSNQGYFKSSDMVFVGYGISQLSDEILEPKKGKEKKNDLFETKKSKNFIEKSNISKYYDSYAHLDVQDKWVVILRFMPENINAQMRTKLNPFASNRNKVLNARVKGAKGVIFVTGPHTHVKTELIPLTYDVSLAQGSLPVFSVATDVVSEWFKINNKNFKKIQKELDNGTFVKGFKLKNVTATADVDLIQDKKKGINIIAHLKGETDLPAIVIGAHYDHLGFGKNSASLAHLDETHQIHPGADDNASGVSGVMAIAEYLSNCYKQGKFLPKRDIVFAFWSGEELGLLGSKYFVKSLGLDNLKKIVMANINLDMIGRMRESLIVQGIGSSDQWEAIIEQENTSLGLNLTLQNDSYLPTDAMSFYLYDVPILSAYTGSHAQYHSPRDLPELINYEGIVKITQLISSITSHLSQRQKPLGYQKQQPKKENQFRGTMQAYLGTLPDYASENGKGVILSGTTKGSPADKAGIVSGDQLIELANTKIENIYDFTYVLQSLKVGEAIKVKVKRSGLVIELEVTPSSRQ